MAMVIEDADDQFPFPEEEVSDTTEDDREYVPIEETEDGYENDEA